MSGEPLLVRRGGPEVAIEQVVGCRADLAHVRPVSTTLARCGDQALLLHQAPHNLLRDVHGLIAEAGVNPPVAVAPIVALEDVGHGLSHLGILVDHVEPARW